jgi:2-oxoglutarate ferredoxin oxidoreductase subunit beta
MTENVIPIKEIPSYSRKDFQSDQTVRWCPGCGDYAILAAVQKALPDIGKRKEDIVFISGIGCSSRFPYYMDTYGIHSIHGRAPTLATGLKIANPDLSVWVITGDGDGLSIGGNHLLHACRRNVDLQILLFNNRIYGLTKGQYSPTSKPGTKTKSSPMGSIDQAFNPIAVALGASATFIARTLDTGVKHLDKMLSAAAAHQGAAFIEIFQNCIIFNDKTWEYASDRKEQPNNVLFLEHGEPMIFGKNKDKGIRLNGLQPEVVELGNGITEDDLLVHDETDKNLAYLLSQMDYPNFPVPFGVIHRDTTKPAYERSVMDQVHEAQEKRGVPDLRDLYMSDYTWTVESDKRETQTILRDELGTGPLDEEYLDTIEKSLTGELEQVDEIHEGLTSDPISNILYGRAVFTAQANDGLADTIKIMQDNDIGAVIVADTSQRPIGIFTESDVLRKVATRIDDLSQHRVVDFMTRNPDVLQSHVPIAHALYLMSIHRYRHVPIVNEDGIIVDVISFRDVVKYIQDHFV